MTILSRYVSITRKKTLMIITPMVFESSGASFQLFLGGPKFFLFFNATESIEKSEKTAFYM